jgi:hypothetical protein
MDSLKSPTAIVQQAEETEQQLIDATKADVVTSNSCAWSIGRRASVWKTEWSNGRTDDDLGELVGLSGEQLRQRRAVWDRFGELHSNSNWNLSWTHFYVAINWEDAEDHLEQAAESKESVAAMKARYERHQRALDRAQNGEDLTVEPVSIPAEPVEATQRQASIAEPAVEPSPVTQDVNDVDPYVPPPSNVVPTPKEKPKSKPVSQPTNPEVDHSPTLLGDTNQLVKRWKQSAEPRTDESQATAKVMRRMADWLDPPNATKANVKFTPPNLDEVVAYCSERQNRVNPEQWHDHYTSNGWKVGKNGMKDWKAVVRNWERSDIGTNKPSSLEQTKDILTEWMNATEVVEPNALSRLGFNAQ